MPEKLKDTLIPEAEVIKLAQAIHSISPGFYSEVFVADVIDAQWNDRELMQKMRHITSCLKKHLPDEYSEAIQILEQIAPQFKGFIALSFSDYAGVYGMEHWDISMNALARFTSSCSSEFAVRPFLDQNPGRALVYLSQWAESENVHIRRLASEGCRPRLPWGMALRGFKSNPRPIIPILAKLRNDPEEYVRRSVANNLNDISKDHPELVLELCEQWKGQSTEINRIIKHACRTLLKAGNKRALMLFGFGNPDQVLVTDFTSDKAKLKIGEHLQFSFILNNTSGEKQKIRLEYRVHYVKSNGKTSPKVFQISEGNFSSGEQLISKKQAFTDFSTRKHFPGKHRIEIVVNGETKSDLVFELEH